MKTVSTILIAAIGSLLIGCSSTEDRGNRIGITLSADRLSDSGWLYLRAGGKDYQNWFIDSLYVEKGQTYIEFNNLKTESFGLLQINSPTLSTGVFLSELDPKFDIEIKVGPSPERIKEISGVGARSNIDSYKSSNKLRIQYLAIADSVKKLYREGGLSRIEIIDIEEELTAKFLKARDDNMFKQLDSQYPERAYSSYITLKHSLGYSADTLRSYMDRMKERFPNDSVIQKYPERCNYAPPTEQTKRTNARVIALFKYHTVDVLAEKLAEKPLATPNIVAYKLGDVVSNVEIPDASGTMVSLDDMDTEYVFIDFWASWCVYCRDEFEYIKRAYANYEQQLTIFAISINESEKQWQDAIVKDRVELFVQTLLGEKTQEAVDMQARFGVKGIPANFLLDKERRIIAINLRGDELSQKLAKLTTPA